MEKREDADRSGRRREGVAGRKGEVNEGKILRRRKVR